MFVNWWLCAREMLRILTKYQKFSPNVKNSHETLRIFTKYSRNAQKNVKCPLMVKEVQEILKQCPKVLVKRLENILSMS